MAFGGQSIREPRAYDPQTRAYAEIQRLKENFDACAQSVVRQTLPGAKPPPPIVSDYDARLQAAMATHPVQYHPTPFLVHHRKVLLVC